MADYRQDYTTVRMALAAEYKGNNYLSLHYHASYLDGDFTLAELRQIVDLMERLIATPEAVAQANEDTLFNKEA